MVVGGEGVGWTNTLIRGRLEEEGIEFVGEDFGQKDKVVGSRLHEC